MTLPNGFMYYPKFSYLDVGVSDIPWEAPKDRWDPKHNRKVAGRPSQLFGSSEFTYAGKTLNPMPWDTVDNIDLLRLRLEKFFGVTFAYCLAGLYEDHTIGIPMHRDEVNSDDSLIVSISYGPTRLFQVQDAGNQIHNMLLNSGDMVVMTGYSQVNTQHAVPPMATPCGPRVNLTFRTER